MPYVYKYTDLKDNQVKYIGIIKKEGNFPKRFTQHQGDWWYSKGDWVISYVKVPTQTDAEMLEAHLIEYYDTAKFYNRAKSGWGLSSYLPDAEEMEWIQVESKREAICPTDTSILSLAQWEELIKLIHKTVEENDEILNRFRRMSIHLWFIECGERLLIKQHHLSREECYENYKDFRNTYGEDCEGLYEFADKEVFWSDVCNTNVLQPYRCREHLTTDTVECLESFYGDKRE